MGDDYTAKKEKIIQLNEEAIKDHLGEMVRNTVEETLNQMLDAEADKLCNAEKYQRSDARSDTRAGHYRRKLHTKGLFKNNLDIIAFCMPSLWHDNDRADAYSI